MISYQIEQNLSVEDFIDILNKSTLGERRPVQDIDKMRTMVENANLIITARDGDQLVGISRSLTDFAFCCYLSDLAVDPAYQRRGIGKELIKRTKQEVGDALLILLAAPRAAEYYPHIGMKQHEACFLLSNLTKPLSTESG